MHRIRYFWIGVALVFIGLLLAAWMVYVLTRQPVMV